MKTYVQIEQLDVCEKYLITNGAIELHGILILSLQNNFI